MSASTSTPSSSDLKAEVFRTRADLAATIDQLTTRISPSHQAARIARDAKLAASDASAMATGAFGAKKDPAHDPRRSRNAKALIGATLGVVAIGTIVAVAAVLRRARG